MLFVTLAKFRKKPSKEMIAQLDKLRAEDEGHGFKFISIYWTLGKYDVVAVIEAPDEKSLTKSLLRRQDLLATQTMVALRREDAIKLVD